MPQTPTTPVTSTNTTQVDARTLPNLTKPVLHTQTSTISNDSHKIMQPQPQQQQQQQPQQGPSIVKIKLNKKNNGLGLSIVAARGTNQIHMGIYIKSVVPGGASDDDGRLSAGDQLLAVDEASLVNVTQERAAELMTKSGPVVCLTIAKDAASYHDLDALLNKSPLPPQQQMQQSMVSLGSTTLPRTHHQFNGMPSSHQDNSVATSNDTFSRSMSQEVLKMSSSEAGVVSPLKPRQAIDHTRQHGYFNKIRLKF